jgi:hypothetical protein
VKSKEFIKRYASELEPKGPIGVYSGRGIGIPVVGAIGGGDGAKSKIGRNKRPYYQGDGGSPSQAADAGFSSYMARVNKGDHPEFDEIRLMFPEQEEEEEDIYYTDYPFTKLRMSEDEMRTKKISSVLLDEDAVVDGSIYSLASLYDTDEAYQINEFLDTIKSTFKDIGSEFVGDQIGIWSGRIPFLGTPLTLGQIAWNMRQLQGDMDDAQANVNNFVSNPDDSLAQQLVSDVESITINYFDLIRSLLSLATLGWGGQMVSGWAQAFHNSWGARIVGMGAGGSIGNAVKSVIIGHNLFEEMTETLMSPSISSKIAQGAASGLIGTVFTAPGTCVALGDIIQSWEEYSEQCGGGSSSVMNTFLGFDLNQSTQSTCPPWTPSMVNSEYLTVSGNSISLSPSSGGTYQSTIQSSGAPLSESKLREFIRESVYFDQPGYYEAQPAGYQFRSPPSVEMTDEEQFKIESDYDSSLVKYKADGGIVNYQSRPETLEEMALRRIIRNELSFLAEDKKKR